MDLTSPLSCTTLIGAANDLTSSTSVAEWAYEQDDRARAQVWLRGRDLEVLGLSWRKLFGRPNLEVLAAAEQSGEQESEESQRIRELLTGEGGYVFHGTRVTGLTWAYRLSGGNLRAVQAIAGHTSPKMALRYQRAEMDYLAAVAGNVSSMIEASARR